MSTRKPEEYREVQKPTLQSCQAKFNCSPAPAQLAAAAAPNRHARITVSTHTKLPQKLFLLQQASTSNTTSSLKHVGSRRGYHTTGWAIWGSNSGTGKMFFSSCQRPERLWGPPGVQLIPGSCPWRKVLRASG
jgi:hypothetical protein